MRVVSTTYLRVYFKILKLTQRAQREKGRKKSNKTQEHKFTKDHGMKYYYIIYSVVFCELVFLCYILLYLLFFLPFFLHALCVKKNYLVTMNFPTLLLPPTFCNTQYVYIPLLRSDVGIKIVPFAFCISFSKTICPKVLYTTKRSPAEVRL